jgi:hypothetical protein
MNWDNTRVASLLVTRFDGAMPALTRQKKITFEEMRAAGVRGLLIYFLPPK